MMLGHMEKMNEVDNGNIFLNCRENHSSTTKIELFNFILFYSSGEIYTFN